MRVPWPENSASATVNTATDTSAITSFIQASMTQFMPTVTLAGKLPYYRCGTSECPNCRIAHRMRRFVQQWSRISARATAVDVSDAARHHAVRDVTNHCLHRRPHISRAMRLVPRKDGAGREIGAGFTVLSSRTRSLRTTSDKCCSS